MAMGYVILPQRMIPMMWLCVTEARLGPVSGHVIGDGVCQSSSVIVPGPGLQHCYNDVMFPWSQ